MFCPRCGETTGDVPKCPHCGHQLREMNEQDQKQEALKIESKTYVYFLAGLVLPPLGFVLWQIHGRTKPKSAQMALYGTALGALAFILFVIFS